MKYSFGAKTLFLCKSLFLFHYAKMASGHMSEHTLLISIAILIVNVIVTVLAIANTILISVVSIAIFNVILLLPFLMFYPLSALLLSFFALHLLRTVQPTF